MEDFDKISSLSRREYEFLIGQVDKLTPSPKLRAEKVYDIIKLFAELEGLDTWDIICFCEEYLMMQSLGTFSSLLPVMRELNKLIYQLHYQAPHEIGILTEPAKD